MTNPWNKAPNKLRLEADILARNTGSWYGTKFQSTSKGQENVGTSRYFFARSQYCVYILWRDAKKLEDINVLWDANSHITQSKTQILQQGCALKHLQIITIVSKNQIMNFSSHLLK